MFLVSVALKNAKLKRLLSDTMHPLADMLCMSCRTMDTVILDDLLGKT